MDEADALCDRVAVMHRGAIAAIGTPPSSRTRVGPGATLDDVFRAATGTAIDAEEPTVTSLERAGRPAAWAEPPACRPPCSPTRATVARSELRKVRRDPIEMATRAVQPILWLVVFGQVMSSIRAIPTGSLSYLDFLAPGSLPRARSSARSSTASR